MRLYPLAAFIILASTAAQADSVSVTAADCRKLVAATPAPDVAYKPGVDVHGKAVVPADLGGGYKLDLPKEINIQIGVNLARRLNPAATQQGASTSSPTSTTSSASSASPTTAFPIAPSASSATTGGASSATGSAGTSATSPPRGAPLYGYAPLGTLTVKGNEAYWNGAPIAPQDQVELAAACSQGLSAAGETLPTPKPAPPP